MHYIMGSQTGMGTIMGTPTIVYWYAALKKIEIET
jgi:hypothetical protein